MSRPTLSTLLLSYQRPKTAIIVPVPPAIRGSASGPSPSLASSPWSHSGHYHRATSTQTPVIRSLAGSPSRSLQPLLRGLVANKSLRGSPRCPTREVHAVFGTSLRWTTIPPLSPAAASSSCAPLPLRRRRSFFPDATPTGQRRTTPRLNLPAYLHL